MDQGRLTQGDIIRQLIALSGPLLLGNILQQHTGDETVVMIDHPESDYLQQKMNQEQQNGQQQEERQLQDIQKCF